MVRGGGGEGGGGCTKGSDADRSAKEEEDGKAKGVIAILH